MNLIDRAHKVLRWWLENWGEPAVPADVMDETQAVAEELHDAHHNHCDHDPIECSFEALVGTLAERNKSIIRLETELRAMRINLDSANETNRRLRSGRGGWGDRA